MDFNEWLLGSMPDDGDVEVATERLAIDLTRDEEDQNFELPCRGLELADMMLTPQMPKFIWEEDGFMKAIFGKRQSIFPDPVPATRPSMDVVADEPEEVWNLCEPPSSKRSRPSNSLCSQHLKYVEQSSADARRASVLSDWASLVSISLESFAVGRCMTDSGEQVTHDTITRSIGACFAHKAASTLAKRYYALNRFVVWANAVGVDPFPLRERDMFAYLQMLKSDEFTAPSAGRSFIEAIKFSAGVLGLDSDIADYGQGRLHGTAVELALRAGPIQQACSLTVQQVCQLERLVVSSIDPKDRVVLGGALVLLYSAGRVSDGHRCTELIMDTDLSKVDAGSMESCGYLELRVLGHKTARSEKMKRTYFLPLVVPIFSMSGANWFQAWVEARDRLGLVCDGKLRHPLICRFGLDDEPLLQEVSSSEMGAIIRAALNIVSEPPHSVRGHSLKITTLSWCGKYGVDLPTRRMLGHHLDASAISAETYNRDSMGPAVRRLVEVLGQIKKGKFSPDADRSGRFNVDRDVENPSHDNAQDADDDDSDYVPGDSSSDESCDDYVLDMALNGGQIPLKHLRPALRPTPIALNKRLRVYRHLFSGMQHLAQSNNVLLCGRPLNDRYLLYDGPPVANVPLCDTCKHPDMNVTPGDVLEWSHEEDDSSGDVSDGSSNR